MGAITAIWAAWSRLDGRSQMMIAGILAAIFVAIWLRYDAANDALRDAQSEADKARIEHITGAKETDREIQDLNDDDFGSAIDGLPRRDSD